MTRNLSNGRKEIPDNIPKTKDYDIYFGFYQKSKIKLIKKSPKAKYLELFLSSSKIILPNLTKIFCYR